MPFNGKSLNRLMLPPPNLPTQPGVYRMLDAHGVILYVGKALNLKKRVSQYFQKNTLDPKTVALLSHVAHIEWTLTDTDEEALLIENHFIKLFQPKYNILLRDDKSYPYILLQTQHAFPRVSLYRGKATPQKGQLFGPYPHSQAAHTALDLLQKCFQLRPCQDSVFQTRSRPCLQYQINRCSAPCMTKTPLHPQHPALISQAAYARQVRHAIAFLSGRSHTLIRQLSSAMKQAVRHLEFEKAATLRDQLQHLRQIQKNETLPPLATHAPFIQLTHLLKHPTLIKHIECFDISHTQGDTPIAACVTFQYTHLDVPHTHRFSIHPTQPGDDCAALGEALLRRYQAPLSFKMPELLLIDGGKGQVHRAQRVMADLALSVRILGITKGLQRKACHDRIYDPILNDFLTLHEDDPVLHFLQHIRDETHRSALLSHRKKRAKRQLQSTLETISGLGPAKRFVLLQHFGGLQGLQQADYAALLQVPGISKILAQRIINTLYPSGRN